MRSLCSFVTPLLTVSIAYTAEGRFYHTDADEVDREERLSSEYFNDINSYDYPYLWSRYFDVAQIGYRVSAGSLDLARFAFLETIKLGSSREPQVVDLHFLQQRDESLLEQNFFQELRLTLNTPMGPYFSLLADGGTFKKWADMGGALGFRQSENRYFEVFYWSVDHYYNSKVEFVENSRDPKYLRTVGAKTRWTLWGDSEVQATLEHDQPLVWYRGNQGYVYEYRKIKEHVKLRSPTWRASALYLSWERERKAEAKEWTSVGYRKSMDRFAETVELGLLREKDDKLTKFFVQSIFRHADYDYIEGSAQPERFSPDSTRQEWALAFTRNRPLSSFARWQWGLFYNRMRFDVDSEYELDRELKIQTAFELNFSDNAISFWNLTWDLDRLWDHRGVPFQPWGGGQASFLMTF
ncbi:MAG: hypothetical protein HYW48_06465 [Deltaproteobacteria bacterium]|nr:hypothetical protein [Deltaproteobacteria bacterium]